MPRRVFYRISDRPDGLFDAITTIEPDTEIRRDGFGSLAEAEEWVDGLRILMAALGAPVAQESGSASPASETTPEDALRSGQLRTAR
ncbi:hypothetical protein [Methylobacterium pseudosasicola]|uniref:Uncharacterized protein n=1 Tax=Methylobacterium pseudosasicola TaxID=582667 RepID=A0A1I4LF16_9HYPH|nr:hypothetical protein [Methylobacterium pseudosasicola]SFL89511.1 hypothetical protein SAMN05192568_101390 [Methylobacterium pseudosasicola]